MEIGRLLLHRHNDIHAWQPGAVVPEGFTYQALYSRPRGGPLHDSFRYRQAQAGVATRVWTGVPGERPAMTSPAIAVNPPVVSARYKPTSSRERPVRRAGLQRPGSRDQALRRARPRARRALIMARPFLVFIRARNPWVRLRLISLGWNVRFMMLYNSVGRGKIRCRRLCAGGVQTYCLK